MPMDGEFVSYLPFEELSNNSAHMSQSSDKGEGGGGGGGVKIKALSAKAASFYPSSTGSPSRSHQICSQSSTTGAAASTSAAATASTAGTTASATTVAPGAGAGPGSGPSPPSPSASQQKQSQSSNGAPSPTSQQQQAWGGLRVRTYSAGTLGTAASVGDTSAAIDHFSEYLYDYEDYEVSSQEVRVAMAQPGQQMQQMQQQQDVGFYDDIETEMDRDQEMADMEGLVVAMNESSGVRVGGNNGGGNGGGGGGGGGIGSSAHEYWFPECRDCGCCRGYKYGCVCVQGGVSVTCKCASAIQRANGALGGGDDMEMDVESEAVIGAKTEFAGGERR